MTKAEKEVIKAAMAENGCRCKAMICGHLNNLWLASERLARARRKTSSKEKP